MEQLWDPLRRKEVAATPEERVRQWLIAQMRDVFGVPEHMMRSEVGFRFGGKAWRADLVVYDRAGKPLLVAECKQPDVALTEAVAEQALRYHSVLKVRYVVLTNGKMTYLYALKGGVFEPLDRIPRYEEMLLCPR